MVKSAVRTMHLFGTHIDSDIDFRSEDDKLFIACKEESGELDSAITRDFNQMNALLQLVRFMSLSYQLDEFYRMCDLLNCRKEECNN